MPQSSDNFTYRGAGILAKIIKAYWAERGFAVNVERYEMLPAFPGMWSVRSDMICGKPRGAT